MTIINPFKQQKVYTHSEPATESRIFGFCKPSIYWLETEAQVVLQCIHWSVSVIQKALVTSVVQIGELNVLHKAHCVLK